MIKTYLAIILFAFLPYVLLAQDFKFGALTAEDVKLQKYDLDSFSNAAVLSEYGRASMINQDRGNMTRTILVLEYHVRIKLFNRDGYEHAEITIPTYQDESGERVETISNIRAETINIKDGRIVSVPLDKSQIFKENVSKYVTHTKFTFPDLQEGSIIEYSYRLESPDIFNFRTWELQDDIPKVSSKFEAVIPGLYNYNAVLRGPYPLTTQDAKILRGHFRIAGRDIDCSHLIYGMENIPAFVSEDYMTAAKNFKSAIYFELSDIYRLNGSNIKITKEWRDVDRELVNHANFGNQIKRGNVFRRELPTILKDATSDLDKAKAVYYHIQKHMTWNRYLGKYTESGVRQAWERRTGNVGDINLSLIACLAEAGLDAEAAILSTRENGVVNDLHPVLSDFNYVVAKVNIGDEHYLLDATVPHLPFGLLPLHCINGKARVINLKTPSYWIELGASQKSLTQYVFNATLQADGILKGQLNTTSFGYAALNKRRAIANHRSTEAYITHVDEQQTNFRILGGEIDGVEEAEAPLVERYQVEMKLYDGMDASRIFFNPFLINRVGRNPFNLDERTYPVDMGAPREQRVMITIELPEGYEMRSKPEDYNMGLENSGGRYMTQTTLADNRFSFSQLLALNQAVYPPESYFALKELFSRIIQQEKIDVVFEKTTAR